MPDIGFDFEWQDGTGIQGAELSATFASLRIHVGGSAVTRVLDSRAKTVRDSVYVPLYPIAEWLVGNWWFLSHEFENPDKKGNPNFRRRHALGTNTEGYALPNLVVIPTGARIGVEWGSDTSPWTRVEFLDTGHDSVDTDDFRQACADLIDAVIRRLAAFEVHDTFLREEWDAIRSADDEESSFCETAAGLGWDPYDPDDSRRDQVLTLADRLGPLLGEAAPVMGSEDPAEESSAIVSALGEAKRGGLELERLKPLFDAAKPGEGHPWEVGYALARRARNSLGLDGQPIPTVTSLAVAIGEDPGSLERAIRPATPLNRVRLVDGVVTGGERGGVSFGLRRAGEHGRRFVFCRALGEAVYADGDALLTRANTARQQYNRAFAAEFLAPSSGLRQSISRAVVDSEEVNDLAEEFGVSTWVVERQIENHRIAEVSPV